MTIRPFVLPPTGPTPHICATLFATVCLSIQSYPQLLTVRWTAGPEEDVETDMTFSGLQELQVDWEEPGFLDLGAADIVGQVILCVGLSVIGQLAASPAPTH